MDIKRKATLFLAIVLFIILAILGIIWYKDFTMPIMFEDFSYIPATMDLQIYCADAIALVKPLEKGECKTIKETHKVENETKQYKRIVTDTPLEVLEIYKGDLTKGQTITYRGSYNINTVSATDTENPNFKIEEKSIVFLKKSNDGTYYMSGAYQSKFVYDNEKNKYVGKHLEFEDMKTEIERYNNTPENERDLMGGGKGYSNDI